MWPPQRNIPRFEVGKTADGRTTWLEAEVVEGVAIAASNRVELDATRDGVLLGRASMKPKPRNAERDAAIVRLHDEERLPHKQIGPQLMALNPTWCREDGSAMDGEAIRQAYRRAKTRGDGDRA